MHRTHLGTLARLSTLLLLVVTSGCLSGSSGSPGNRKPGSGGSGTAGGNGGSGGSAGSGGTSAGSGGVSAGTGGSGGSAGTSSGGRTGNGGTTPGTGGGAGGGSGGSGGTSSSGKSGTGGSAGAGGGSAGSGGTTRGTGGTTGSTSSFTVKVELSTAIPTVGIATWSLGDPIDSATIDFGRDQSSFELQAPVDLAAENHRTLLLGMKQNTTYYVRVTANGGGQTYVSQVASIKTGSLPAGLPVATVTDKNASALYAKGGFTVSCMGWATSSGGATGSWAFIIDPDGAMVWAYDLSKTVAPQCTRARMSLDGKYMWANNFGNTTPDGALARIAMDGLGTLGAYSLPGSNHDFAILPDDHVVYIVRDNGGSGMQPESLFELDPSTSQTKLIYRETTDFGSLFDTRGGHTNQVNYVPDLKAISFSMYFINTIGLVSYPEAKLLGAFGGKNSTFSTMSWTGQHGHDIYRDHMVLFNNEGTNGARTIRFKYDLQAKTATEEASYSCGLSTRALGDVKELPNGNYFITYSMLGTMHEIDSSMKLLRETETGGASIGYAEHRASLYGRPPPYDR